MKTFTSIAATGCLIVLASSSAFADVRHASESASAAKPTLISEERLAVASAEAADQAQADRDNWLSATNACLGIALLGAMVLVGRRRGFD